MFRKILLVISVSLLFASAIVAQDSSTAAAPAATPAPAKKPPVFRPTKDQIKQVQTILKDKKLYDGEATGTYNNPTRAGIKSFQKDNGLTQTGTLNRATLEKFGVELTDSQKASPVLPSSIASTASTVKSTTTKVASTVAKATTSAATTAADGVKTAVNATSDAVKKPAPFRANADQIKAAQKMLKDGKMYMGEETGKLDDATREGLGKYQEANKIKVTKTLNAVTLEKMGIALTDAQKANVAAQAAYDASKSPKN